MAAEYSVGDDSTFHTEQVSATLTRWNFDGSMAMERLAVQRGKFGKLGVAAQQGLCQPSDADDACAEAFEAKANVVL